MEVFFNKTIIQLRKKFPQMDFAYHCSKMHNYHALVVKNQNDLILKDLLDEQVKIIDEFYSKFSDHDISIIDLSQLHIFPCLEIIIPFK